VYRGVAPGQEQGKKNPERGILGPIDAGLQAKRDRANAIETVGGVLASIERVALLFGTSAAIGRHSKKAGKYRL
jgi:hypothetical protein